jgi:hypothetical protein
MHVSSSDHDGAFQITFSGFVNPSGPALFTLNPTSSSREGWDGGAALLRRQSHEPRLLGAVAIRTIPPPYFFFGGAGTGFCWAVGGFVTFGPT